MIALYDEHFEFRHLFTYEHSSTHTSVLNRSSSMFACENHWGSILCYAACLSFLKNQWGSILCYTARLSFLKNQWGSILGYAAHLRAFSRTNEVQSWVTQHIW